MSETKPSEFEQFLDKLMDAENAPKGYKPWLLPCKKDGKDPDTGISWKAEKSRLTPAEAIRRLENNWGNVGLSGRKDDQLILVDIDDPSIEDQLKPTLKIRSRSRVGTHAIYWADPEDGRLPMNIPTDKGEIRSSDQYVVAPGSYVPCTEEELTKKVEEGEITEEQKQEVLEDDDRGYYTLDNNKSISTISFEELPEVFREQVLQAEKAREEAEWEREEFDPDQVESERQSALYKLTITDVTGRGIRERDAHPLHVSDTGANWIITGEIGHCWRHGVSLNAIQFLCVDAGYASCVSAGTPHKSGQRSAQVAAGPSIVRDNDEAIWVAWKHAKENGFIPEDDPMPLRAMHYIARKHDLYDADKNELLPPPIYNKVIQIVEEEY